MKKILSLIAAMFLMTVLFAQSVPKLLEIADDLYQNDRYLEAIEFYERIVGIDKDNHFARFRLASCYHRTLQYEEAKSEFVKLSNIQNHEYRARSLYNYANLLKQESRFKEAD